MAEGAVSFLIGKLGFLISQEADFLGRVKTQIVSLHRELEWINSFIRDADENRHRNNRVNIWVTHVRSMAYDAEDIIDLFILEVLRRRQRNIGLRIMGYPKHLFTLHKLGNQVEDIKRSIEEISANRSKYGIETLETGETSARLDDCLARKRKRDTMEDEVDVVGFEKDIEKLATLLKQEESRQLLVVSVVGMGGLGKTTLSKKVYNRSDVKNTFDSCAWIYVSQEYRIKDLLLGAIAQLMMHKKEELEKKNEEDLKNLLSDYLKERRCLFVFDDVWQKEDWDRLKSAFLPHRDERKQQRVLVTTRMMEVAKADPSIVPYELQLLGAEESFELFSKKVFQYQARSEERSYSKDLKDVGRKLVAKCGGLPLAIVVLGGLLSTKERTPSMWNKVLESVNWQLNEGPQQCMDILALSYRDLPYYLQSCFLYFGLYPEDYEIYSKKLIQLWVAEGFIQQRGEETMEDTAEGYLEELIDRSMIQAASRRSDGGVQNCRIHDLLRDLAISEAKKDKLLEIYGSNCSSSLNRFRRLAIHPNNTGMHPISSSTLHHLHSLLCFSDDLQKNQWKGLYVGFNLLRVLDLKNVRTLEDLPKEIGGLVLLKFLNLCGTELRRIPCSIGNLCNLQTLDLSFTYIRHMPKGIWRMQQLRHLFIYGKSRSILIEYIENVTTKIGRSCCGPPRVDNLRDLQTLHVPVGSWIEGGLNKLTNLREVMIHGELRLHKKALTDSIFNLKKLRVLELWDNRIEYLPSVSFSDHVHLYKLVLKGRLEKMLALEYYPPYLIELRLYNSHLKQDDQPMATLEKLPNLKILNLGWDAFEGKEMICSAGGFAKLQNLRVEELKDLKDLKVEQRAFPCLKVLTIRGCNKLEMLPDGLQHVTTLQMLNIYGMPKEFKARLQKDAGEDWEKIKHIPSVTC